MFHTKRLLLPTRTQADKSRFAPQINVARVIFKNVCWEKHQICFFVYVFDKRLRDVINIDFKIWAPISTFSFVGVYTKWGPIYAFYMIGPFCQTSTPFIPTACFYFGLTIHLPDIYHTFTIHLPYIYHRVSVLFLMLWYGSVLSYLRQVSGCKWYVCEY